MTAESRYPESRYPALHARSISDPEGFWLEAARAIDWFEKPARAFDPTLGVYGRWFPGGVTNVCHNAVDRHVAAGRGAQPAIYYDSPVAGREAHRHLCRAANRGGGARRHIARARRGKGRPRRHLHADDPRGGVRHAGLRPHRRHPFGGVRRLRRGGAGEPHRRRRAEGRALRLLRHRAEPHRRLQAAARPGADHGQAQAGDLPDLPAPAGRGEAPARPRPRLGERAGRGSGARHLRRLRAGRGNRPALYPLHLRHDG